MRSILLGGGIAGCAMAAGLRGTALGARPILVERRASGRPAGMGFLLLPNGIAALEQLAPEIAWRTVGRTIDRVELHRARGGLLRSEPLPGAVCVAREPFLRRLQSASGDAERLDGRTLVGLAPGGDGAFAKAVLDDGSELLGDVFFGCDGAQSRSRTLAFPHSRLSDVVVQEIVSTAQAPGLARALGSTFRKFHADEGGLAAGLLAANDHEVVWFVQFASGHGAPATRDGKGLASFVYERLRGWSPALTEAMATSDFDRSHLWPTRDLEPLTQVHARNLALLGDAAHACLPFTSQGANGALADAACLQRLLRDAAQKADVERAFAAYSELRRRDNLRVHQEGRRLREAFLLPLDRQLPAVPLAQ